MIIPKDPFMLLSMVNMKLRDGDYESLDDFCKSEGFDCSELTKTLGDAGFTYMENIRQFK